MVEMAKMQLEEAKERLPNLEEEIKFIDTQRPEDAKNVVVEIRAGTGGDGQVFCWRLVPHVYQILFTAVVTEV